jgi:hypothetical protein
LSNRPGGISSPMPSKPSATVPSAWRTGQQGDRGKQDRRKKEQQDSSCRCELQLATATTENHTPAAVSGSNKGSTKQAQKSSSTGWVGICLLHTHPHLCLAVQGVIDQLGVVAQLLEAGDGTQHPCGLAARQQAPCGSAQEEVFVQGLLQGCQPAAHHLDDLSVRGGAYARGMCLCV